MREEMDSFVDKKQSAKNEKARKEEEKKLMGKSGRDGVIAEGSAQLGRRKRGGCGRSK